MSDHCDLQEIVFVKIEPIQIIEEDVQNCDTNKERLHISQNWNQTNSTFQDNVETGTNFNLNTTVSCTYKYDLGFEDKINSKKIDLFGKLNKHCKRKNKQKQLDAIIEGNVLDKIIQCCLCPRQFTHASTLKNHRHEHFQASCLICTKIFTALDELQIHIKKHLKEIKCICPSCGRTFRRAANLDRHEPNCRKEKPPIEQLCTICGKLCQSKWQLQQHMMFHSDERPFSCMYCPKTFRFKARLQEHERTHLGIKPYSCDICSKSFTTSSDLKKHEKRHAKPGFKGYNTENNPNKLSICKVCDKNVINLKNHMKVHNEDSIKQSSDICSICRKIVKAKSQYQHIKLHLKGSLYKCDICNRNFNRKDNMLSHRDRHSKAGYKPKSIFSN